MAMTPDAWRDALLKTLPPGKLWNTDEGSNLWKLFDGIAASFARADSRLSDLIPEMEPETLDALLEDWEAVLGLPNQCMGDEVLTEDERRATVESQLYPEAEFSERALRAIAERLGRDVDFEYHAPLRAGFRAGDRCWSMAWQKTVRVLVTGEEESVALECLFRSAAHAEVEFVFEYGA
jgi:uncharacterized protein YmfQ (DUF2313 family)